MQHSQVSLALLEHLVAINPEKLIQVNAWFVHQVITVQKVQQLQLKCQLDITIHFKELIL